MSKTEGCHLDPLPSAASRLAGDDRRVDGNKKAGAVFTTPAFSCLNFNQEKSWIAP